MFCIGITIEMFEQAHIHTFPKYYKMFKETKKNFKRVQANWKASGNHSNYDEFTTNKVVLHLFDLLENKPEAMGFVTDTMEGGKYLHFVVTILS